MSPEIKITLEYLFLFIIFIIIVALAKKAEKHLDMTRTELEISLIMVIFLILENRLLYTVTAIVLSSCTYVRRDIIEKIKKISLLSSSKRITSFIKIFILIIVMSFIYLIPMNMIENYTADSCISPLCSVRK